MKHSNCIDDKKVKTKSTFNIDRKLGCAINLIVLALGTYFKLKGDVTYSVTLGDTGSITSSLFKGFALNSGRSLLYVSIYGLFLTAFINQLKLKDFYAYYVLAEIVLALGSLIYFIV